MAEALKEAAKAGAMGEVPIGAVIVKHGEIIARAHNLREAGQISTAHAELLAIEEANRQVGFWRLDDCVLYVTLEPCPMCAGAILMSRVERVVFGARDPKGGCCGSIYHLLNEPRFNHECEVIEGVMAGECGQILTDFFKALRQKKKAEKQNKNIGIGGD